MGLQLAKLFAQNPTETNFFARAGMEDTRVGRENKDDSACRGAYSMSLNTKDEARTSTSADILDDGDLVRRGVTIRKPINEVRRAWESAGIAGTVDFKMAPGTLGTEVRVTAPREQQSALKEIVGAWTSDDPGESLSTKLRQFKAQLETGEVATTIGQPSGRDTP